MRSALLLAAACIFCQAGNATPHQLLLISLSRPNTDPAVFAQDRDDCLWKANIEHWAGANDPGTWARHHLKMFGICMGAKGYKNDPHGVKAIRYMEDDTRRHIFVEPL